MPCDTRLLTFNEMLRVAKEQLSAGERRLAGCRTQLEIAKGRIEAAQERLDGRVIDEAKARQAYIDWLSHPNTLSEDRSPPMREKLTGLYNARTQAVLNTLSARETVSSFQKSLDEAAADFTFAQGEQRKLAEDVNLITNEIAKLSGPTQ